MKFYKIRVCINIKLGQKLFLFSFESDDKVLKPKLCELCPFYVILALL